MKPPLDILLSLRLDRRGFLAGTGLLFCGLSLPERGNAPTTRPPEIRTPQRAIYMQMPYFDRTGHGETYTPSRGSQATRNYLAGLNQEELLRRHWFS
jgi:hypothetical protein